MPAVLIFSGWQAIAAEIKETGQTSRQSYEHIGQGSFQVVAEDANQLEKSRLLPLKHTDVRADISGNAALVEVTQVFANPADGPIEAVYVFPLPENAAVDELTLKVAGRLVHGMIKKREEAETIYEDARAQGKTAALLE
ncbi:MAG: hypothetical protein HY747_10775 [Elusimicrobia bacterium]|nr:hypothetical protein [Elusimicrobiota bacterium]